MDLIPDRATNAVRSVGSYVSNLAREARDVPTALGTALNTNGGMAAGRYAAENGRPFNAMAPVKNLVTQIGEVGKAVVGQSGTTSGAYSNQTGAYVPGVDRGMSSSAKTPGAMAQRGMSAPQPRPMPSDPGFTKPPKGLNPKGKNTDPGFTKPPKGFTKTPGSGPVDPGFTKPSLPKATKSGKTVVGK